MPTPIITVKNLVKKYGNFTAVNGISFEVNPGEIFGLLGPNGAGKSTTLEIIETLREKTSGEIWVNGLSIDDAPEAIKKIIGVQLQTAGFYPNLTLTELIELFVGLYQTEIDPLSLLKKVNLFDVYEGKNLEEGKKSYAVSFYFQDPEQTLKDTVVDDIMQKIRAGLEQKLQAQLR